MLAVATFVATKSFLLPQIREIYLKNDNLSSSYTWASADFFPREGKNFPGARTYFLPKKQRKRYYFSQKKSKNILFLAGLGPPLRTPMLLYHKLILVKRVDTTS
jgi:hypothetical protein